MNWRAFFEGMGSIACIYPVEPLRDHPRIKAILDRNDAEALADDWAKIDADLREAINKEVAHRWRL
jgi:hypothetical protein